MTMDGMQRDSWATSTLWWSSHWKIHRGWSQRRRFLRHALTSSLEHSCASQVLEQICVPTFYWEAQCVSEDLRFFSPAAMNESRTTVWLFFFLKNRYWDDPCLKACFDPEVCARRIYSVLYNSSASDCGQSEKTTLSCTSVCVHVVYILWGVYRHGAILLIVRKCSGFNPRRWRHCGSCAGQRTHRQWKRKGRSER